MFWFCSAVASNEDVEAFLCGDEPEAVSCVSLEGIGNLNADILTPCSVPPHTHAHNR